MTDVGVGDAAHALTTKHGGTLDVNPTAPLVGYALKQLLPSKLFGFTFTASGGWTHPEADRPMTVNRKTVNSAGSL